MKKIFFSAGFLLAGTLLFSAIFLAVNQAASQEIQHTDEDGIVWIEPSRLIRFPDMEQEDMRQERAPGSPAKDSGQEEEGIFTMAAQEGIDGSPINGEEGVITRFVTTGDDGSSRQPGEIRVIITQDTSPYLPEGAPDAGGVLLEQSGSSILIGKFSTALVDGKRACSAGNDSKTLKIMLRESTRFVKDATDFSQARSIDETPDLHIQQVLRLVKDPGELPQCASLLVWGEGQGDLITADVILFHDEIN